MSEFVFLWALVSLVNIAVFEWILFVCEDPGWGLVFVVKCISVLVPPVGSLFLLFAYLRVARQMKETYVIYDEYKSGSEFLENL